MIYIITILDEWETCHADCNIPLSLSSHIYTSNSHFQFLSFSGMDELSEDDKLTVARARKAQRFMSQPFHVAEVIRMGIMMLIIYSDDNDDIE